MKVQRVASDLIRHTRVLEIVGDMMRVKAEGAALDHLAIVENTNGETSIARVVELNRDIVTLQVLTGGKGISTEDYVTLQKSLLLDMVYLQQDAFDEVDASMSRERQLKSFHFLKKLIRADYRFKDKEEVREFFTKLTGLYKNWNYAAPESPDYGRYEREMEDLTSKQAVAINHE